MFFKKYLQLLEPGLTTMYGAGVCNDELNYRECFYDNGDCCLNRIDDSGCTDCVCHFDYRKHANRTKKDRIFDFIVKSPIYQDPIRQPHTKKNRICK